MPETVAHPSLTLVEGTPDPDPFIPFVAETLVTAGFPADLIPWLHLPAPAALELAAAMGPARTAEAVRP